MFVRTLDDVIAAGRLKELQAGDTRSARYLTAADGMGFSFHVNRCRASPAHRLWYKHHWEANYIISGKVRVTDLTSGESWLVAAGDLYQVGPNDRHHFEVLEDDEHVSVFCPALHGDETHDADGSYCASGPVPETDRRMFVRRVGEMRANGKEMVVANGGARTVRALTAADGMGFSLSDVGFSAGAAVDLWYKHHWEANYVISGTGSVEDLGTGEVWPLAPGSLYNVGPKDRHRVTAETDLHLVSVFCPPLRGDEQHDADGALEPGGPVPPGPPGY